MNRRLIAAFVAAFMLSGCASRSTMHLPDEVEAWSFEPYPSVLSR